ncbi:MAG: MarR family winged helix-turn-helix transcriptional regulator [Bacteroidota bacterium]
MKSYIDRFLKHIHDLPEQKKMLISISYSSDMITKHFELILDTYLITPPQYNLLAILQGTYPKPCSLRELKEMIIDRDCDVSRMVQRLQANGLVENKIKKEDRRAVDIVISQKGLDLMTEIDKTESAAMFHPFFNISETEARQLNMLLQKVLEGLAANRPL